MISAEMHSEIRRLFFAEHFTINAICNTLNIHHVTVEGAIENHRFNSKAIIRPSLLDPYVPFVRETLESYPKMSATRLYQMLRDRGYKGSVKQVRRRIKTIRPKPAKAYLALQQLPAEHAQVDWGSFGTIQVENAKRKLSCFVMVLSYSRHMFAKFTLDQTLESFLKCHVEAFNDFGGVSRKILYDNLKACVLERLGKVIRFNPSILDLSSYYHFIPLPCNVASGWEKGTVERMIRYLRDNFIMARKFKSLDDANVQLKTWLDEEANKRPWPQDRTRKVNEVFAEEQEVLMKLPENAKEINHVRTVHSGKTPYVRYDLNDYSIPYKLVRQPLTLIANDQTVRLLNGTEEVARHIRSYARCKRIENPDHISGLLEERIKAKVPKGQERICYVVPEAKKLFQLLVEHGGILCGNVSRMVKLLNQYGEQAFRDAVIEAVERKTPRAYNVETILIRNARVKKQRTPLPLELPEDPRVKEQFIPKSNLSNYDQLATGKEA